MPSESPRPYMPPRSTEQYRRSHAAPQTPGGPRPPRRPPRPADVRRRRRRVLFALYASLALELGIAAFTSPAMGVKRVQVAGATDLPPTEAAVVQQTLSLTPGTNWLRAPVARMEQRLRALPWVRTAQVQRAFPNAVEARVVLREPCVVAKTTSGWFELDADGTAIRPARQETSRQLPRIVLKGLQAITPGMAMGSHPLMTAIHLYQSLQHDSVVRIAKIEVDQSGNLCLNMKDGVPIQFGQDAEIPAKLALVRSLYTREPDIAHRLTAINLSCPGWPACTPRVAPTSPPQSISRNAADPTASNVKGVKSGETGVP